MGALGKQQERINLHFTLYSKMVYIFAKIMTDALVCPLATLPKYLGLRPQSSAAFS